MTTVHIWNVERTLCAACGTEPSVEENAFVDDIGYWNTMSDRCLPAQIMRPDYSLVTRSPDRDNQTAAMKEDYKNPKRQNQKTPGAD